MDTLRTDVGTEAATARALTTLRARAAMDIAFGARVSSDARAMRILQINGGHTRSLANLTIMSGAGLGGKALALGQPARVRDYVAAKGITHVYDYAVQQEQLCTVAAFPVHVANAARYVVYLGSRTPLELGDRWLEGLAPVLRELEREIAIQDEVTRRMRLLVRPTADPTAHEGAVLSAGELGEIASELADLAGQVGDEVLKSRLLALRSRVATDGVTRLATCVPHPRQAAVQLTPRETAVLMEVAAGCTNADAAERLGLLPNTVKSYLSLRCASSVRTTGCRRSWPPARPASSPDAGQGDRQARRSSFAVSSRIWTFRTLPVTVSGKASTTFT